MIDLNKLVLKGSGKNWKYSFAGSGAVSDLTLMAIATDFENSVMRKMSALTPTQLDKRFASAELILATVKYDGEGVFLYWDEKTEPFLFNSPSGRLGLPLLGEVARFKAMGFKKALLRGELYLPPESATKRRTSADVNHVSASGTVEEIESFRLAVIDIVMLNGVDWRDKQSDFQKTWDQLTAFECSDGQIHPTVGKVLPEAEVATYFGEGAPIGLEGLVFRRLNRQEIYKVKPHLSVDAVIVGYVEGEFEGQYGVTSVLTALNYPDKADGADTLQVFIRAGSGFTDAQRTELLPQLSALKVESPLTMTDSDGRLIHFVQPRIVVELHGEELVSTRGERENVTQVLVWNGSALRFQGLAPCPRLTFGTFNQVRADKSLSGGGARIAQVVERLKPAVRSAVATPRTVIRREVFVKGPAVRKLVITEQQGEEIVPYLLYWTDFSAKRAKDPLKTDIYAAFTQERMEALATQLKTENIPSGWLPLTEEPTPPPATAPKAKKVKSKEKPPKADAEADA